MVNVFGLLVALGLWLMAYSAWDGMRYYGSQFQRWCIAIVLAIDGMNALLKAFTL